MRVSRLLLACLVTACSAVPLASPALAQEPDCSRPYGAEFVDAVYPTLDTGRYVSWDPETITIHGDYAVEIAGRYVTATQNLLVCLHRHAVGVVTPYVDCVMQRSEAIRTSPDPAGRYVEVSENLVVRIHHGLALREATAIWNCNGVVTSG
ncbi:MAG: hypothetical protein M3134_07455 [Actinomycetota bacterium]|nr:hypothetical protein [Actinomycetota bacterium]